MLQLFMLAHLITIAQAPTFNTEILAISTSKVSLKELAKLLKTIGIFIGIDPSISLIIKSILRLILNSLGGMSTIKYSK
jgi:hypothetical protein